MEVSALKYSGGIGLHARTPLLRLQSDERLVALVRRGNTSAFEMLVSRYESRLLAFCRHMLGSREDAEDVLQEVFAAAYNAMLADNRPINVKPWLYRIARNRSLNQLRRAQAIGVDSMDVHLSEHGQSTADVAHEREEFRLLVGDIHELPETQKTALVLREMDALSYEQIAEAMETTVPSVKSLLVRARVSLAESAEARLLTCGEVRVQLAEVAEGLTRRPGPIVRRHLRSCKRCSVFQVQLKETNKALTALLPIGPFVLFKKLLLGHIGHSAGAGSASGAGAAGPAAALSSTTAAGTGALAGSGSLLSAGVGALATKAAAGLAEAALVTAGAVEVSHVVPARNHPVQAAAAPTTLSAPAPVHHAAPTVLVRLVQQQQPPVAPQRAPATRYGAHTPPPGAPKPPLPATAGSAANAAGSTPATANQPASGIVTGTKPTTPQGRTVGETDPTVLHAPPPSGDHGTGGDGSGGNPGSGSSGGGSGGGGTGTGSGGGGTGTGSGGGDPGTGSNGGPTGDGGSTGSGGPTGDGGSTGSTPPPDRGRIPGGQTPPPVATDGQPTTPAGAGPTTRQTSRSSGD